MMKRVVVLATPRIGAEDLESWAVRTSHQLAILVLLANGATVKEVAAQLGMKDRTVQELLARMRKRTGTQNTVQLVAVCMALHQAEREV